MEFVRLVHPRNFDRIRGRFNDLAFKKSTNGGMSVFEVECAKANSGLICDHIKAFYENVGGEPPVFYILNETELPTGYGIQQRTSDSGDECHHDVVSISNNRLKKAFKDLHWSAFFICDGSDYRALTQTDVEGFASV